MSNESSNESTRVHSAQSTQIVPVRLKRLTAAGKALASALLCLLLIFGAACDDDNNSKGEGNVSAAAKIETQPIDLPLGETEAGLAWEASLGPVTGYLVFASRNGSAFGFETNATEPTAIIPGRPGDELRIVVVAVSENGSFSDSSPPSVPIRFHAAEEPASVAATTSVLNRAAPAIAQVVQVANLPSNDQGAQVVAQETLTYTEASATEASAPSAAQDAALSASNSTPGSEPTTPATTLADDGDEAAKAETQAETQRVAILERLLGADARLAPHGRSDAADAWVQSYVDEELVAGVRFIGTGEANGDDLRELVWQDASGQLFVSDGETFLDSEAPADTLREALRLQATERFVAFDDLDGNAGGEWLIEDTHTGQTWIADANAASTRDAILLDDPDRERGDALQLIGLGDFDGDGRGDLLWQAGETHAALAIGIAENGWLPAPGSEITIPNDRRADLALAIADLNGDGRDELLSRDRDGRLRITLFVPDSSSAPRISTTFQAFWAGGPDATTGGLALVGTLDLDQDGESEIAWVDDRSAGHGDEDGLQIWDTSSGPVGLPEF